MMFASFHQSHEDGLPRRGWAFSEAGSGRPYMEEYHGWRIEVTACQVGITIQRTQYRAAIRHAQVGSRHALRGFPSVAAACAGAWRWIDGQLTRQRLAAERHRATPYRNQRK
jgi:hypothetical protein